MYTDCLSEWRAIRSGTPGQNIARIAARFKFLPASAARYSTMLKLSPDAGVRLMSRSLTRLSPNVVTRTIQFPVTRPRVESRRCSWIDDAEIASQLSVNYRTEK